MRRRQLAAALAMGAALLACTACTSSIAGTPTAASTANAASTTQHPSSGKAGSVSPDQVASLAITAYQRASAVHIKGSLTGSDGTAAAFDLQLNKDSGSGTLGYKGTDIPLIWVNGVNYIKYTDAVLTISGKSPTSGPMAALRNKWLSSKSPVGSGLASIADGISYDALLPSTVGALDRDTFTAAGSDTVNGVAVLKFKATDGSTVHIAASSPHYVMRMAGPTPDAGSLDFTGWDQPVAVTAPPASEMYTGPGS